MGKWEEKACEKSVFFIRVAALFSSLTVWLLGGGVSSGCSEEEEDEMEEG